MWFLGPDTMLTITEPHILKELLLNKNGILTKGIEHLNKLTPVMGKGLVTTTGKEWALHRRIVSPAFHHDRIKVSRSFILPLFKMKVTFGEISLKLCQTNWNVAKINPFVVDDGLPNQITVYTCLTIDIWTQRHWRTSTRFYGLRCYPPKMTGFHWNWRQKFSTTLWTPLARRKALSESYHATHAILC